MCENGRDELKGKLPPSPAVMSIVNVCEKNSDKKMKINFKRVMYRKDIVQTCLDKLTNSISSDM